ncbi:hypothetical protein BD311DRAFT_179937 [Dichomitus squalens]|uniref:Uncharacterized protein n=1 Tax=Dichomitus squalens TaxID=114155 RepID=A0A4Q9M6E2_9APHY|nr:hypothetical protein BD311DRAFT_179937 [Dichomitus squalens]
MCVTTERHECASSKLHDIIWSSISSTEVLWALDMCNIAAGVRNRHKHLPRKWADTTYLSEAAMRRNLNAASPEACPVAATRGSVRCSTAASVEVDPHPGGRLTWLQCPDHHGGYSIFCAMVEHTTSMRGPGRRCGPCNTYTHRRLSFSCQV